MRKEGNIYIIYITVYKNCSLILFQVAHTVALDLGK